MITFLRRFIGAPPGQLGQMNQGYLGFVVLLLVVVLLVLFLTGRI